MLQVACQNLNFMFIYNKLDNILRLYQMVRSRQPMGV
jgi:hypothetical protein